MEIKVHYYSFHIKDYHLATAHLTVEEDCCYRRILDLYYDTEGAIGEAIQVARRVRMPTPLVEQILSEFFDKSENGWSNSRADKEIAGYQRMANGGKKGAIARWNREGNGEAMPTPSQPQCQPVTSNHKPRKTYIPDDFSISEAVRKWADGHGYKNLDIHLAYFIDACKAKGYQYTDWDAAFRNAIKGDWAKVGVGSTAKKEDWRSLVC